MSDDSPLLPDRHRQGDFFVCDILDAAPKADIGSMEHPIFSLSTKPDIKPRKYEHNGITVEVKPSVDGLATVHDRDILIFCISQIIRGMNDGREAQQVVRFQAADLLKSTNRTCQDRSGNPGWPDAGNRSQAERLAAQRDQIPGSPDVVPRLFSSPETT